VYPSFEASAYNFRIWIMLSKTVKTELNLQSNRSINACLSITVKNQRKVRSGRSILDYDYFSRKHRVVTGIFFKKMKPLRQVLLPKALGHKDYIRIIHAVEHTVCLNYPLFMYSCWFRLGEAIRIQVGHIEKSASILTIIGKYNR
jgi:integrase